MMYTTVFKLVPTKLQLSGDDPSQITLTPGIFVLPEEQLGTQSQKDHKQS